MTYKKKKSMYGYFFVSPWILGVLLFFIAPFIRTIFYSFNTLTINPKIGFVTAFDGLRHYRYMFQQDEKFLPYLSEALVSLLYTVPLISMFSLLVGVLINQNIRGRVIYRAILFLPVIVTSGVVLQILSNDINSSLIMSEQIYQSKTVLLNITILNDILRGMGLSEGFTNMVSEFVSQTINITWYSGVQILLVLAGLQSISPALYEAARIEGATGWDEFWKITFPSLTPVLFLNVVYTIVDSFTDIRNPVMKLITSSAFSDFNYSYACAVAMIYCVVSLVLLGFVYLVLGRRVTYTEK